MKRKALIISISLRALLLLVVFVFQGMVFPNLRIAGLSPMLLPLVSTGFAVNEGRVSGGITGIFAGILCDLSLNEPVGLFTIVLTFTGLAVGTVVDAVITRGFVSYLLLSAGVLAICAVAQAFPLMYFRGVLPEDLISTALWQTVYSLIFTFPTWLFIRALGKRVERASS